MKYVMIECSKSTNIPLRVFELTGIATIESAYYVLQWHLADCMDTNLYNAFILSAVEYPNWDAYEEANAAA